MAFHDYSCWHCETELHDQYRTIAEGGSSRPPLCPSCGNQMGWVPQARFDLRSDSAASDIPKFTTYDGQNNLVEIDSLHKLRTLERESEQQARNGEGQPLRFRAYSQNRSNIQDNTFGPDPASRPSAVGKKKFGLQGATRKIDAAEGVPVHSYGPGVNDSNTSALDSLKP